MGPDRPATVRIDGRDHLSTEQVARFLGVKRETVYAYVSRGVLTPARLPGRRESYFPLAEVELLVRAGSGSRRRPPALSDDVQTMITLIEADRLSYRGRDACTLAATSSFEQACELLWQHPAPFRIDPDTIAHVRKSLSTLPSGASLGERMRMITTVMAARNVHRGDRGTDAVTRAVAELIMTSAVALADDEVGSNEGAGPPASVAEAVARAGGTDAVDWVDQACILLADHDMAGSTTAARVAASVRCDPYAVLTAALAAWESPLHGSASRQAYRLLAAVVEEPAQALTECLASTHPPAGFGHLVYTEADPRAEFLLGRLAERGPHPALTAVERLSEAVWRHRDVPRTVDLALAAGAHVLGARPELGQLIFGHARMAGWTAHLLEEYAARPMRFRLRGVYTGPRPATD